LSVLSLSTEINYIHRLKYIKIYLDSALWGFVMTIQVWNVVCDYISVAHLNIICTGSDHLNKGPSLPIVHY